MCSVANTLVLLTNRIVRWCRALDLYGYAVETPVCVNARLEELLRPERWLQDVEEMLFDHTSAL